MDKEQKYIKNKYTREQEILITHMVKPEEKRSLKLYIMKLDILSVLSYPEKKVL